MGKQQSTLGLIFGTGTPFMGKRKINTRGIKQVNKVMHLLAIACNLTTYRPAGVPEI
ncbi:Transposase domain protein [Croceitalea dokdonensis DOKDO 023]|uniref:Transposase domain protein n=1 Tax=Croceitalea dokdonensis DOKDO 023 TaxID=1300341 RepID=A0A0P7B138_9FLAO|nr:Transposase domain protein [Croceitalea dokdonensis DOKDO 023]